jgi:hypothetical protein
MKTLAEHTLNRAISHHIENEVPFYENVFRPHSEMSNKLFMEAKRLYNEGAYEPKDWFEEELLQTDIGEFDIYEGETVPLDIPLEESEYDGKDVELNKPKRGGSKKFYVYVKDPSSGNIKKVSFGDTSGLTAKINNPEARKSFAARHNCADKTDKTSPGYWACRLPRFAASVGLSGGGSFFW